MKRSHDRQRGATEALGRVTREMRDEALPSFDDDAMRAALFARLAQEAPPRVVAYRSRLPHRLALAGVAAAAAAVLVVATSGRSSAPTSSAPTAFVPISPADLSREVIAAGAPVHETRAGLGSWVAAAGSRLHVVDEAERTVVTLDEGSIVVDVVPQPVTERFVVVAGRARVAVHGTHFRVARIDGHVEVDVSQGVVAVADVDATEPAAWPRWRLRAPAGGSFDLGDVEKGALRALAPFDDTPAAAPPPETKDPSAPTPSTRAPGTEALRARLTHAAEGCFNREAPRIANVNVSATTTLTADFQADGRLRATSFDPPLAPAVEACFRGATGSLRGRASSRVDVALVLTQH